MSSVTAAGSPGQAVASDPDRILPVNIFTGMFVIAMLIILLDGFPDRIGVIRHANRPGIFMPLLSPEFQAHIPLLNFWWGLSLALALAHLYNGRWTSNTRLADVLLRLLAILILARLLSIGPIVGAPSRAFQGGLSGVYLIRINEWVVPTVNLTIKLVLFFWLIVKLAGFHVHYQWLLRRRKT